MNREQSALQWSIPRQQQDEPSCWADRQAQRMPVFLRSSLEKRIRSAWKRTPKTLPDPADAVTVNNMKDHVSHADNLRNLECTCARTENVGASKRLVYSWGNYSHGHDVHLLVHGDTHTFYTAADHFNTNDETMFVSLATPVNTSVWCGLSIDPRTTNMIRKGLTKLLKSYGSIIHETQNFFFCADIFLTTSSGTSDGTQLIVFETVLFFSLLDSAVRLKSGLREAYHRRNAIIIICTPLKRYTLCKTTATSPFFAIFVVSWWPCAKPKVRLND